MRQDSKSLDLLVNPRDRTTYGYRFQLVKKKKEKCQNYEEILLRIGKLAPAIGHLS